MFKKISKKIGFTEIEIKVILFLVLSLMAGFVIKILQDSPLPENKSFDYNREDSLFNILSTEVENKINFPTDNEESSSIKTKNEVLGLSNNNFRKKEIKQLPAENSIDINSAVVSELIHLPGIGEKTAQSIIDLRNERGHFKELEELKDVKGIGEVKFNKIKKFLYIKRSQ